MTSSNPSHLLINRNPPLPAHPQLFPQSTSRHSHSHAHARHRSAPAPAPNWSEDNVHLFPSADNGVELEHGRDNEDIEEEEVVDVHPTFARHAPFKGRVKVFVGRNEFWCHKEILWFASPFFQGLLQGSWAENTRHSPTFAPSSRRSSSPTDTDIDALPVVHDTDAVGLDHDPSPRAGQADDEPAADISSSRKGSVYLDAISEGADDEGGLGEMMRELREIPDHTATQEANGVQAAGEPVPPHSHPTSSIPALPPPSSLEDVLPVRTARPRVIRHSFSSGSGPYGPVLPLSAPRGGNGDEEAEAVVELHEESASAFQDFLYWAYPHLDCKVSWTNVAPLVALSSKLLVPALSAICYHFLLTHASGKPIVALSLAEEYEHAELYREASRFVLDLSAWDQEEMEDLSEKTRLKLSQRRTWFLERLLKLGSIDVRKEYSCRIDCPDPARCQALVDDKWRQAHNHVCRHGPAQPSVAFRCLRQLETFPQNPTLIMPNPHCQAHAKSWLKSLFDRMFGFRLINSPLNPGTEKYWLAISL